MIWAVKVRSQRVIVDADLAALYDVETKRFNEAVKRNLAKVPADFMFSLTAEEFAALRSQFATLKDQAATSPGRGGRRYAPRVFTEHGALMAATNGELAKRLDELEQKTEALAMNHDTFSRNTRNQLKQVFDALRELMTPPDPPKRPIGFVTDDERKTRNRR